MRKAAPPTKPEEGKKSLELMDIAELHEEETRTRGLIQHIKSIAIDGEVHKKMLDGLEAHLERIKRRIEVLTLVGEVDTAERAIGKLEDVRDGTKEKLRAALRKILAQDVENNFDNIPSEVLEKEVKNLRCKLSHHWEEWLGKNNIKTIKDLLTALKSMNRGMSIAGVGRVGLSNLRNDLIEIGVPEETVSGIRALNALYS